MTESEGHRYLQEHQISGEVLLLDLIGEGRALLDEARAAASGRAAKTLLKEGPLRITLLALKAGTSVKEHKAGGPVSIAVLLGQAQMDVRGQVYDVQENQSLVLGADVAHSVTADSDSVLVLTIAMP